MGCQHAKTNQRNIQISLGKGIEDLNEIVDWKKGDQKPPDTEKDLPGMFVNIKTGACQHEGHKKADEIGYGEKAGGV
jgi:hypothetical protein